MGSPAPGISLEHGILKFSQMGPSMNYNLIPQREQDIGRGTALLVCSAVLVLLKFTIPWIAWLAFGIYGIYRLFLKDVGEGLVALALAVVFFFLSGLLAGLLWVLAALVAGAGLFFLIRAMRTSALSK